MPHPPGALAIRQPALHFHFKVCDLLCAVCICVFVRLQARLSVLLDSGRDGRVRRLRRQLYTHATCVTGLHGGRGGGLVCASRLGFIQLCTQATSKVAYNSGGLWCAWNRRGTSARRLTGRSAARRGRVSWVAAKRFFAYGQHDRPLGRCRINGVVGRKSVKRCGVMSARVMCGLYAVTCVAGASKQGGGANCGAGQDDRIAVPANLQ
eukprot:XP_001694138.1 predicted protein [Chlamydomonas reinhardtii]